MESPDDVLVCETLNGRRMAFDELTVRYQNRAHAVAAAILSDFDLARDVVQESLLLAYQDLPRLQDPARFGAWFCGIVRHTAYRALRELKHIWSLADHLEREVDVPSAAPSPLQHVQAVEGRRLVWRAVQRLGERDREAVILYYMCGRSYAQIAAFAGTTETAVQGRLQRARTKLKEELVMVEREMQDQRLPEDFSQQVQHLLDTAAAGAAQSEESVRRLAALGESAVEDLCEAMARDERQAVRFAAARALCRIGDPRAVRPLLRALYAGGPWVDAMARSGQVLGLPGMRDELLRLVRDRQTASEQRYWAIHVLGRAPQEDEEVYEALARILHEPGEIDRLGGAALGALLRMRPAQGLAHVQAALRHGKGRLRRLATWLAVQHGILPPIEDCLVAFGDGATSPGRLRAGYLLLEHGEEGRRVLRRVLREGNGAERSTAAAALAREGDPEALETLRQDLIQQRGTPKWLRIVSRVLAHHSAAEVGRWLRDDAPAACQAPGIVWTAVRASQTDDRTMQQLLEQGTPAVRVAALRVLAGTRGTAMLPDLAGFLTAGHPAKLAREAFAQILRMGSAAAEPAVRGMLEASDWSQRRAAVGLLRRWGKLGEQEMRRAQTDAHPAVRAAAVDQRAKAGSSQNASA